MGVLRLKLPKIGFPKPRFMGPKRQLGLQDLKRGVTTGVATIVFIYFLLGIYFLTLLFFEMFESNSMAASLAETHSMDICAKISSHPYPVFRCMNMSTACLYAPDLGRFECESVR